MVTLLRTDWVDNVGNMVNAAYLNALGVAVNSLIGPAPELFHDFTKDPNGPIPTLMDSGHSRVITWNRVASTPVILNGRYIDPDNTGVGSGAGASYITVQLANSITYTTADFDFSAAGTTNGQLACIAAWASALPAGLIGAIPDSPLHLVLKAQQLEYGVWSGNALTIIGTHVYAVPFTTQTQHVEITIDKANSTATVLAPDGVTLTYTHALIGSVTAPYATAEILLVDCANDHDTRFQKWTATSQPLGGGGGGGTVGPAGPAGPPGPQGIQGPAGPAGGGGGSAPAGTSTGWANVVVDYGADPTGGANSGPAFRNAAASGKPIWVPAGTYQYSGAGMSGSTLHIEGAGNNQTSIILAAGVYFVDSPLPFYSFWLSGIRFTGGQGHVRQTYAGTNVNDMKVIQDNWFYGYTGASIQTNSTDPGNNGDNPYWKISRNIFYGANFNTCMGIALKGLTDSCVIQDNEFLLNRVACKIDRGNNCYVRGNDFLRFGGSTGSPRIDIWVVGINPATVQAANAGSGMVITENKFGNEFLEGADHRILYADEGAGAQWGDRMPVIANSGNMLRGHIIHSNLLVGNATGTHPLVYSCMPDIRGMVMGPNSLAGIGSAPVLKLRNATGFNHTTQIIGPLVSEGMNQLAPPAWVVAESGTLSGQPKSL